MVLAALASLGSLAARYLKPVPRRLLSSLFKGVRAVYRSPWTWIPVLAFGLDQILKHQTRRGWLEGTLLWKGFGFQLGLFCFENKGVGGGFFQGLHSHNLLCLQMAVSFIAFTLRPQCSPEGLWSFAWIFWGCLSNIWDRMRWDCIVDYLELKSSALGWCLHLNAADCMIFLGFCLLLLHRQSRSNRK